MESRAKELIEILATPNLIALAIKYASKLGRIHLAEKLNELLPQFEKEEKERNQYDEHESASDLLLNTPVASTLIQMQDNASPSVVPVSLQRHNLKINECIFLFIFYRDRYRSVSLNEIHSRKRQQVQINSLKTH